MDNVFTSAVLQICEVAATGAVCFALVSLVRPIQSALKWLDK